MYFILHMLKQNITLFYNFSAFYVAAFTKTTSVTWVKHIHIGIMSFTHKTLHIATFSGRFLIRRILNSEYCLSIVTPGRVWWEQTPGKGQQTICVLRSHMV